MKKAGFFLILATLLFCSCTSSQERNVRSKSDIIREKLLSCDESTVLVCAHRGDWRNFPENSIAAIDNAIAMGADIVELDVQMTKDSVLILMHDSNLDRTTTGKGNISETGIEDIRKLFLKNGCSIRTIHKVPELEDALLHAKGKIMINLDKADRYFDKVYEVLEKTGTISQVIMKGSRNVAQVREQFGTYLDKVIYMPVMRIDKPNAAAQISSFCKELDPPAFELIYKSDSNPLPLQLKDELEGKSLIWYNTLWQTQCGGHDDDTSLENIENGYAYLIDKLGARIIQTDRPQFLLDYLRSRGLHD